MVERPQRQVHLLVGQGEVELVLALAQAVGVRGRYRGADALGQAQVACHAVHLRLVEVRDRLDVGRAVAVLDEETLVVFDAVRRADHAVVEAVGVEVLQRLADALLEIGCGHDGEVIGQGQVALVHRAVGRLRHQAEPVDAAFGAAIDDDLELPAFAVFGQRVAHRLVAGAIAADRRQRGRDVHGLGAHAQVLGQDARARSAVVGGVLFGQDQREDAFGPQGAHGERAADGTVDAAGDRDHQAAAVQLARGDLAQARADAVGFALVVDVEDVVIELAHGLAVCSVSWMRRTLPDAVRGRVSTKVMCRGIL